MIPTFMNNLKIYFAGSIRGGREDADLYLQIIDELKRYGSVLTEHVGDNSIRNVGEQDVSEKYIHDRDLEWIHDSDLVIAEVTVPSLGVGYEIASAINLGKPVYCFFNTNSNKNLSAMIRGSKELTVVDYQDFSEIKSALLEIFNDTEI
jgi:nucleoside 2-deoxyribosyltransferase